MNDYELLLTYHDGTMKKERATLSILMRALSIYFNDDNWLYAEITNRQTGEIICRWGNLVKWGVTSQF